MRFDNSASTGGNKKDNRQAFLLQYLEQNHYISLEEIAHLCSVTMQTARRDIMALETTGKVRRIHGGATIAAPMDAGTYRQRRLDQAAEKQAIAAFVADYIPNNTTIFIDTGTTCEAIAAALIKNRQGLRIVTYSLRVASLISENSDFALAIPGGFVRAVDGGIFQEDTPDFINRFKFDYAVISVSGIDDDGDLCDDDRTEVAAVSKALDQSRHKLLAVDSSKFGKRALVKLGALNIVDAIITDKAPAPHIFEKIQTHKLQLHLCEIADRQNT